MTISLTVDGTLRTAKEGEVLATVLFREPEPIARKHPVDGTARAPYCMMGVCFECLVEVDGIPDQQACLILVADGMKVNRRLT